jgi:hypothetical protein
MTTRKSNSCESRDLSGEFAGWLAETLDQDKQEAKYLLENKSTLHFLIAWSLFETRCFGTRLTSGKLKHFSELVVANDSSFHECLLDSARHFHVRYQDKKILQGLVNTDRKSLGEIQKMVEKPFDLFSKTVSFNQRLPFESVTILESSTSVRQIEI